MFLDKEGKLVMLRPQRKGRSCANPIPKAASKKICGGQLTAQAEEQEEKCAQQVHEPLRSRPRHVAAGRGGQAFYR